jgi:hypothetical protein
VLSAHNAGSGLRLRFKWLDNVRVPDDAPIRWIDTGDAAPNGRFAYRYSE